jgi:hypothetical protein
MPKPMPPEAAEQLPLPEVVADLDVLHPYWHQLYEPVEGGFGQCRELREAMAETEAAHQARLIELRAQHDKLTRRLQTQAAEAAIKAGLRAIGGVKPGMERAVGCLLLQELQLTYSEDASGEIVVAASTPFGPANVSAAVASWGTTPEAQAYLNNRPQPVEAGEITSTLKRFFER